MAKYHKHKLVLDSEDWSSGFETRKRKLRGKDFCLKLEKQFFHFFCYYKMPWIWWPTTPKFTFQTLTRKVPLP